MALSQVAVALPTLIVALFFAASTWLPVTNIREKRATALDYVRLMYWPTRLLLAIAFFALSVLEHEKAVLVIAILIISCDNSSEV
jgi:hypothetical protein